MTLDIDYENFQGYALRPGAKITGAVRFSSTKDEAISSVTLALSGRCKVKIREHLHYTTRTFRSRGYYFYKKIKVFEGGSFTHKAGDYAWPFSFDLPTYAEQNVVGPAPLRTKKQLDHTGIMKAVEDQRSRDFFPATAPWRGSNDLRPHLLPDSFTVSHTKWPIDLDAKVQYALIARLERPTKGNLLFQAKDIETLVDLTVKAPTDRSARSLLSRMQVVGDEDRIRQIPARTSSVKGTTWSNLYTPKPKQLVQSPAVEVFFSVKYPVAVCASSTLPFVLCAEISKIQEAAISTIKGTVTDLTITMLCKTSARDDSQAATEHTAIKLEKETLCWRRDQQNIDLLLRDDPNAQQLSDQVDLEDLIHTPALTPSFSTYNLAKEYFLEYDIKIRVSGQAVTFVTVKESGLPISVLPAGSDNITREWSQTIVPAAPPIVEEAEATSGKEAEAAAEREGGVLGPPTDDEVLPAYQP